MKHPRDSYASVETGVSYFTDNSYHCLLKSIQRHDMNVHINCNFKYPIGLQYMQTCRSTLGLSVELILTDALRN